MHVVTWDNSEEVSQALRDILMMYADMAGCGGRLTDANMWIRFDPLKFVDAEPDGRYDYGDLDLLRTGSAIAILGSFYDNGEEDMPLIDDQTGGFVTAIEEGRLGRFPDIVSVVKEALRREQSETLFPWFDGAVDAVYRQYVNAYFSRLAAVRSRL